MAYRADIDGLRTLAVVPVVLFHAGVSLFSGGYVGVDVFFVISGYLITGILVTSIERDAFSIIEFYKRRIRRIFPALLLVLTVSTIAAWFLFMPERLIDYGKDLVSVAVFLSNFRFWKAVDYFSNRAHVQPLLHTWSLSVEEQFYIFYPMLLFCVSRTRLALLHALIVVAAISFVAACMLLATMPREVFYLLPFRAWELVVGGLVAVGVPRAPRDRRVATVAGVIGAMLTLVPMLVYRGGTPFPGLAAVPPVLGAALIIWSGVASQTPLHRLLSTAPFVLVGRASYSFYLWHFPIFAFAAYLLGRPLDAVTGVSLAVVALLAAFATLRWLETPVRHLRSPLAVAVPMALMVLVALAGALLIKGQGYPARLSSEAARYAAAAGDKTRHHVECLGISDVIVPPEQACRLGDPVAAPSVVLWGDSHAMVTATAMEAVAKPAHAAFLFAATADCPPGLGFAISPDHEPHHATTPSYRFCGEYNRRMFDRVIHDRGLHTVVLSARWTNWRIGEPGSKADVPVDFRLVDDGGTATSLRDNARIFEAGFDRLIAALLAHGKIVYIVGPVPEPDTDVPQALFVARYGLSPMPSAISMSTFQRRHAHALAILARAQRLGAVRMIWPHTLLCRQGSCPIAVNGRPTFFDDDHLSVDAARRIAPLYAPIFADRRADARTGRSAGEQGRDGLPADRPGGGVQR